ncbi:phenylalanine--tRNA ligase subunit alpha [Desulfohalobiaceae bacterium Ax17]|jgi:phenylalanyl-tRNA synthetase alpha chain|uniref:phenylalanine--tRNA ligase subunit alpha n=1 Tax=Desulfovulcanus ferrireducens TaxID=2831190 RepID=UPI00207BAA7A|nr:phenylalanine--tRNA ligase subunit alpha [Desulfovulcanus ferrireducens]MBT8762841.1 phenylalanine--tRNA ligase subunit alpha [Desulfovulcanus ferrireducens]
MISVQDIIQDLEGLIQELEQSLGQASSFQELEKIRVEYLGRKGRLAQVMSRLPELSKEDRPQAGKKANEIKNKLHELFEEKKESLEEQKNRLDLATFDPTIPGRNPDVGSLHPITRVIEDICSVFIQLGFDVVSGPEVENDFYNFEALNIPPEHPARDMQDTLYITDKILLRTHTSPLQIRTMLKRKPPVAAVAPGKVYRRDSDLTHTPMFHQIEGFLVDTQVSMADLRGTLTAFLHRIFGPKTRVRFRPSFFPFTEPSAEVDISCVMCGGEGKIDGQTCRVCKETGWVEILGCGMIDPAVFAMVDYDPEKYSGFAFGLGVERIAMLKYGIGDLRMFFENDIRFLQQFV